MKKILEYTLLLLIIILIIISAIKYLNVKKDKDKNNSTTTTTKITTLYNMKQTEIIGTIISDNTSFIKNENGIIRLEYPIINIKSIEIKELNSKIKNNIDINIKNLNAFESLKDDLEIDCIKVKMKESNKITVFDHFTYLKYEIIENNNYLSIIEWEKTSSTCAGGYNEIKNIYIIDKTTNKIISKKEFIEKINNYNLILNDLISVLEINDTQVEVINQIKNNEYYIYYSKDNNLTIRFLNVSGSNYEKYEYIENEWKNIE